VRAVRSRLAALVGLFVVSLVACGGSKKPAAPTTAASASSAPADAPSATPTAAEPPTNDPCTMQLYGTGYDAKCQAALDKVCCGEQKACVTDGDCKALITCINACPRKKGKETENCIGKCSNSSHGAKTLDTLATCSKKMPPSQGKCDWP
jgi:hypothetical protein